MSIRILQSGPKAQDKGDSRNHGLYDASVSVLMYACMYFCTHVWNVLSCLVM